MGQKLADGLSYPPGALRADRAAAYLSISTSMFLELVDEGRLPQGKKLGKVRFWVRRELDDFLDTYEGEVDEVAKEAAVEKKWSNLLK
jgi:predicted DNA-binding transcriptional regulator AlpA